MTYPQIVIRSWSSGPLKHSKSSRTITTGGWPQCWIGDKLSSTIPYTLDEYNKFFAGVFLPALCLDLISRSGVKAVSVTMSDFLGLRFLGDRICSATSLFIVVSTGDAGDLRCDGFLTGDCAGKPEFVSGKSCRCNTTTGLLDGVLGGETGNNSDLEFPSVILGFSIAGEFGSISSNGFTLAGESLFFGVVRICCNFWGVAPLRRPALEPAGDVGYFCGDSRADIIKLWRFEGVPVTVVDDKRFCGDVGTFVPHLSSVARPLLAQASDDGTVYKKQYTHSIKILTARHL